MADKKKLIVVCGPTASGKTGLSIALANRFGAEIISADSMQIYKHLDIGTAKATKEEQAMAKHHLVDILEPDMPYSVNDFVVMAKKSIDEISFHGKIPIVAGGTGLYIESLLNGVQFARQEDNTKIKEELRKELAEHGIEYMHNQLVQIDPEYAQTVHPNNTIRVLRGIEVYRLTGQTMSVQRKNSVPPESPYDFLVIGLTCEDRQKLYDNINHRVDLMLEQGLLNEARYVYDNRNTFKTCVSAIGYKELFPYFDGEQSLEECIDKLKQASRNYAKRQLTWFNRMKYVNWLYIDKDNYKEKAISLAEEFLGM